MSEGDRTVPAVVAVTVVALAVRTVELGARIFHWDEGRVGYWALRFHRTGEFSYRPIIHGPFLPVVDNALFDLLGATDFAARLPVAVVGGLLPLVALGFRAHLSDRETVALAALLAVDPLLVYYSRFLRSDVLVGAFAVTTLAFLVAAHARRRTALFLPAAASLALAFTAKENALVYVACFLGAGLVLLDHRLVRTARHTGSGVDAAVSAGLDALRLADDWTAGGRVRAWASRRWGRSVGIGLHLAVWTPVVVAVAAVVFLAVAVFFYAPRPDLWGALGGTRPLGPVLRAGSLGAAERFAEGWVEAGHGNPYPAYFADLAETLVYGSGVTVALAVVGFLADGYGDAATAEPAGDSATADRAGDPAADAGPADTDGQPRGDGGRITATDAVDVATATGSRGLVAFAGYWAVASLIGYPVATDIQAPWAAVHVTLPLTIPAAVGLVRLIDTAQRALADRETTDAALAGLVVLAAAGGVVGANADYWNAAGVEDRQVLQWAQPDNDLKEALQVAAAVAGRNEGTDLLFVGTVRPETNERLLFVGDESAADSPPAPGGWFDRLPLPWYTAKANVTVTSTPPEARYDGLPDDPPPVVIAYSFDRAALADRLPGYAGSVYDFRLWRDEIAVFVDRDALARLDGGDASSVSSVPDGSSFPGIDGRLFGLLGGVGVVAVWPFLRN